MYKAFGYVYPIHIYCFLFFKVLQLGQKKKGVTNAKKKSFLYKIHKIHHFLKEKNLEVSRCKQCVLECHQD
jgi:hypothetical protein